MLKSIRKVFIVFLSAVLCLSSIHLFSSANTSAHEVQKNEYISALKTAWENMYEGEVFASFDSNSKIMNQNNAVSDLLAPSQMGITFNADGTFDKATYEGANFGGMYYLYGMTFNKDVNGEKNLFTSNINSKDNNSFNTALNNDSLNFTFNPGTVTAAGNIRVYLQYNGYGNANVFYSTIDITADDSNKDKKIVLKDLTYKCASTSTYSSDWKLTKLSDALKHPANENELVAIKIFFNLGFVAEGASISSLQCRQNATLPEGHEDFGIIEWYNAAASLDISSYKNTKDFTDAIKAMKSFIDENCQEELVVAPLKNAWSKMMRDTEFGNFDSNSKIMNQKETVPNSLLAPSKMGITFNADGTFDKATYEGANFNGMYYLYGMTFNKDVNGVKNLFTSNINSIDNNSFNAALNNDSLNFTFNPGNVTADGNICVYLQYNDYGNANVFYSKIDIKATDSNKDKKIVLKDLTYKCADTKTYSSDWKLTKLSDALKHPKNNNDLVAIKIFFNLGFVAEGASISPLRSKEAVSLPEGYKNFTALQWYHAASDLSLEGIDNTDSFTVALENVRKYLVDNNDEFAISLLQKAWTSMYKMTTVANLKTEKARNENEAVELTKLGISFTDITNSEAGYVFNKTAHDSSVGYNNFLIFNSLYWDSYANAYKFFDSDVSDNSFNKAFTDNDDIVITFNTGEVKTAGKIRIVLRYKSWNTVYREIGISESNKEIKLSFKELFGLEKLSDALIRKDSDNDRLYTIRVAFSSELETNSAKIYPLKTLKYAELPENTDGFTAYDWLDAAQSFDYSGYFETEGFLKVTEELEGALYTPVEIAEKKLRSAWGKMYNDTFFASLTGKDNKFDDSEGATGAFINNDVKVSADDIAVIGDEYTAIDKAKGTNMRAIFHDRGGAYQCLGVAGKVKNYDTIVVNIYTGNITNNGTMYVYMIDQSWNQSRVEYPLSVNDSNKWIEVDLLKELGYADMEAFSNPGTDSKKPSRLDLSADSALGLEGMVVGMFAGRTYCPTPSEDISAEELLNIALELDIDEYTNTDGFISGMKALYKAVHGVELPDLAEMNFFDSKANVEIHIERQSRIDDIDVVGIKSTENNISQELSKWIADASFKAIENTYKIELVNSKGKIADIGNREVTLAFNLPSGVEANEVNLLEMNGDDFKLVNCVYYEDKLVFDTKNFINGKSYAILVLS